MSTTQRILVCLLAAAVLVSGDTLIFRNGSRVEGTFIGGDNRFIRFAAGNQTNTYNLNDIESIRFSAVPPPALGAIIGGIAGGGKGAQSERDLAPRSEPPQR